MPGSLGTLPAPELPNERRFALVIATAEYKDASLRQLRSPARDAADLSEILADPQIGGFEVTQVLDGQAEETRLEIEDFLADRLPADLLLVYLSCHGLIDPRRHLYFAATNTRKDRLAATGIRSDWLLEQMEDCYARRQVIVLDCCFSGAFAQGAKGDTDLDLRARFERHGRGRVVLTASRGSEYSFEGEPLPDATLSGSVFTTALVEGIRTGAADKDADGYISVDEAYGYAFAQVQKANANQTPQRWLYGAEGDIYLARSPAGLTVTPAALPEAMRSGLESPYPAIRLGTVSTLGEWLSSGTPALILAARDTLVDIAENDIPRVAGAARALLDPVDRGNGFAQPAEQPTENGKPQLPGNKEGGPAGADQVVGRQIRIPFMLPSLGESISEGTVTRWFKKVGDQVIADEPILELSTDKIDLEIPAPTTGTLTEIKVAEGQTVPPGTELAVIAGTTYEQQSASAIAEHHTPTETYVTDADGPSGGDRAAYRQVRTPLPLPPLGESISEGTVTRWFKKVGDQVIADEPILEVSTDKIDTEIPAPTTGTLAEIKVAEGQTVAIGTELAVIVTGDVSGRLPPHE